MNCIYCYCKLIGGSAYPQTATNAPIITRGFYTCSSCSHVSYSFSTEKDDPDKLLRINFKLNQKDLPNINLPLKHAGFHFSLHLEGNELVIHEYLYYEDMKCFLPQTLHRGPLPKDISPTSAPKYLERLFKMKAFL